jgi:hypothetical protein
VAHLGRAMDRLASKADVVSADVDISPEVTNEMKFKARQRAVLKIKPIVRQLLLSKLDKSGIKEKTGKIRELIGECLVWYSGKQHGIVIGWKDGVKATKEGDPYIYASALNYGAVYGARYKRKHVKNGTTEEIHIVKTKSYGGTAREMIKSSVGAAGGKSGSYRVGKKYNFFFLTQAEEDMIMSIFDSTYDAAIKSMLGATAKVA